MLHPRHPRAFPSLDVLLVLLLFFATFMLAQRNIADQRAAGAVPFFYQSYYEPAIRVACGQPFGVDTAGTLSLEMRDFLALKRDDLDCKSVPQAQLLNPNPPTKIWYHLFTTASMIWKVFGISWTGLMSLASALFALAAVALYLLFRMGMAPPIALALAFVAILPAQQFLLFLRDLNKAPFILAAIAVSAWVVLRQPTRSRLLLAMVAVGALLGVGYGFRPDVLIGLPLVAMAAILFRDAPVRVRLLDGFAGSALMLASFSVLASPVFQAWTGNVGSCQWHFALLGLSDIHTGILGLTQGPYSFLTHYDDHLLWRTVESYVQRGPGPSAVGYCTPAYDAASRSLYFHTLLNFPADFMERAGASSGRVLRYGVVTLKDVFPGTAVADFVSRQMAPLSAAVAISWAWLLLYSLARNLRVGLFILSTLALLCVYPVVQFDTRHFFHLAFVAWLPLGIGLTALVRWVSPEPAGLATDPARPANLRTPLGARAWMRACAIAVAICGTALVVYALASWSQGLTTAQLTQRYLVAPTVTEFVPTGRPGVPEEMAAPADLFAAGPIDGRMLRVDLDRERCGNGEFQIGFEIAGPDPAYKFPSTRTLSLTPKTGHGTLFMPVYFQADRLTRIAVSVSRLPPTNTMPCPMTLAWLKTSELPPLWVTAKVYAP